MASSVKIFYFKQNYMRTLVFHVRSTFLIHFVIAVIALTVFVKTTNCEAVHIIEFTLPKENCADKDGRSCCSPC
jgi:hypothetical protein